MEFDSPWDKSYVAEFIEDFWTTANEIALRQAIAAWVGQGNGRSLLDVGCGSARVAPLLQGWDYHGVDGSQKFLDFGAARVDRSKLVASDISRELPFEDGSFDAVLCMQVIRHLDSYDLVLAEMVRVAKEVVYLVDMWCDGTEHRYGNQEVAGVVFPANTWALSVLETDALALGCKVERQSLEGLPWGVTGVTLRP